MRPYINSSWSKVAVFILLVPTFFSLAGALIYTVVAVDREGDKVGWLGIAFFCYCLIALGLVSFVTGLLSVRSRWFYLLGFSQFACGVLLFIIFMKYD